MTAKALRNALLLSMVGPVLLAGCNSTSSGQSGAVARSDMGGAWPLTVSHGTLSCDSNGVVFEAPDGLRYAINGTAQASFPDYPPIQDIWALQPGGLGLRKDISPLIDRGRRLC